MNTPWFQYPEYSWQERTAAVIGAGIAGRQVAWHLAEQGWKVTVLERNSATPEEASGNLAGIISPKVTAKPSIGEKFYLQCYEYVRKQLSEHPDWHPVGVLQLAYKDRDLARWEQLSERNFPAQLLQCLDAEQASKTANIPVKNKAVYFPQAGWIAPRSFCNSLSNHTDIELKPYTEAIQLEYKDNRWHVKDQDQQIVSMSEALVICSGKNLDFEPISDLPVIPIAGQTTQVQTKALGAQLKTVIDHEGYITPRIDEKGTHIIGATYERESLDTALSEIADLQNIEKQQRHLPELVKEFHEVASGHSAIRMVTPDRFPYLGAVPKLKHYKEDYADLHHGKHWKHYPQASYYPNLFIAAAFASRGMTTTALCAKALVRLMENKESPFSDNILHSLHPARFLVRELKRGSA